MILYNFAKFFESTYRDDRWVKITFIFSFIINIAIWISLWLKIRPLAYISEFGDIPLHYNIYFGIDKIGPWYFTLVMPIIGLLVIIVNNALGYIFYHKEKVVSYFLIFTELLIQIILGGSTFLIILLNT